MKFLTCYFYLIYFNMYNYKESQKKGKGDQGIFVQITDL